MKKFDCQKPSIKFDYLYNAINCMDQKEYPTIDFKYDDQKIYIEELERAVKKYEDTTGIDLTKHITVKTNTTSQDAKDHKHSFRAKYEITIEDLKIILGNDTDKKIQSKLYLMQTPGANSMPLDNGLIFIFKNNVFMAPRNMSNQDRETSEINGLEMGFTGEVRIDFINNKFDNVDLSIDLIELHEEKEGYREVIPAELTTKVKDKSVDQKSEIPPWFNIMLEGWGVSARTMSSHQNSKKISNKLDIKMHDKDNPIQFRPEDMRRVNKSYVMFKDNKLGKLFFKFPMQIGFEGKNIIDCIFNGAHYGAAAGYDHAYSNNDIGFDIYWGPYNQIDKKGKYAKRATEFFLYLKDKVIHNQDKSQEAIINYELTKCQHKLIKKEWNCCKFIKGQWNFKAMQDRFILGFGSIVSDHGTSLWRPIRAILSANLIAIIGLAWLSCIDIFSLEGFSYLISSEVIHVFVEMLNPFSSASYFMQEGNCKAYKFLLSLINIFQKGVLYVMTYEIIRVGRRFVIK